MSLRSQPIKGTVRVRELVLTALLGAILFAAQVTLAALPNIELVSLLLILYTVAFGLRPALGAAYVFALLEGLIYGFGLWWIMYLYVWPALVVAAWLLRKNEALFPWVLLSSSFGLCFGALCAIPYALVGGLSYGAAWWVSGIPYDIAHCVGNAAAALVLFRPMLRFFLQVRTIGGRQ